MDANPYAYGRWGVAITMIVISTFFILRYVPPKTRLGKRSGGALILWPFVFAMYVRLACREERDVLEEYPDQYAAYARRVPMFFPRLGRSGHLRSEKAAA